MELNGEKEGKLDIGTLSLILAVAIALLFVCIITGEYINDYIFYSTKI